MNVLSRAEQRLILNLMCRDNSIADIVDVTGHSSNTVRAYLARFGEALLASHDRLIRGIAPTRVEADELWSFVYAKRIRNISLEDGKRQPPSDFGDFWTWIALDPDSKLLISWLVGDRSEKTGLPFLVDLNSRVVGHIMISTDGYSFYEDAIRKVFGTWAEHVVIEKNIEGWRNPHTGERGTRVKEMKKVPRNCDPKNLSLASTSLVERFNASLRNFTSRLTRQTFKFSKRLSNHVHAQAIFAMYYNFVKRHDGLKGAERHWSPAMKAGLTDKIWSYDDLLDAVDQYWQRKAMQPTLHVVPPRQYSPLAAGETSPLPYFVMYSPVKREAKVHKGTCGNCRQGLGRSTNRAGSNEWYAFETERAARRCAETLAPVEHSVCSLCVKGQYVKHHVKSN